MSVVSTRADITGRFKGIELFSCPPVGLRPLSSSPYARWKVLEGRGLWEVKVADLEAGCPI